MQDFDYRTQIMNYKKQIIGIGAVNVFPLISPATFLKNYSMMSIKKSKDLDLIKKDFDVFCLEEEDPDSAKKIIRSNPKELLSFESSRNFIKQKGKPDIFARKTTPGVQNFCDVNGLNLLGNKKQIRDPYENKLIFRNSLIACGIKPIEGEVFELNKLNWQVIKKLQKKYGKKLVLQAAELAFGGGVGTGFVTDEKDFESFMNRMQMLKNGPLAPRKIENIIVTRFVAGTPSSILGCVTRHGVITGPVQTQLQDIPNVSYPGKGSGVYCGHDWSYKKYSDSIIFQAQEIARIFGKFIGKSGYKGIFGLDLIINESKNKVYPIECNPRYTDALPVLSLLSAKKGVESLEYYHFLEFLGVDYDVDVDSVSKKYAEGVDGSQILIMSKFNVPTQNIGELEAGIYKFEGDDILFDRPSYNPADLNGDNEFLLTDGVPYKFTRFKRMARIMRAIFPGSVLKKDKELSERTSKIIERIYDRLDFKEIKV